ncbi:MULTISPECIES: LLM class flavin-dependent oxidoreductase [unclassified Parafrankia]|uniref:LLM class flavin-dependent oxidoreductase n=1 Tax=unclassified Parafrankia TaxID=2994368 RepID=UPI000DA49707|nr:MULTISPECIES: LLM class flavin-dependent oxidoreductase [unclassified Parafrankia]TCJ35889.1 LLM class flavin-dependent oxidoreductase [Parafrankia sp. BMG5.11]SQD94744.1 Luciferase family protein [Parafrankia sp. Ea1.12]
MPPAGSVPLSVLDLAPLPSGSSAADALRNTLDLARQAERFGYTRYWLAEHHLTPGVASAAPAVLIALVAAATERIRVGSGAVQTGHDTAVVVAEQFGTIAHLHPGRVDLGLGRSNLGRLVDRAAKPTPNGTAQPLNGTAQPLNGTAQPPPRPSARVVDGLLLPESPAVTFDVERLGRQLRLVGFRDGPEEDYTALVRDIQAFVGGTYRAPDGTALSAPAAEGADLEIWILAATAGGSALTAAALGLPLGANYHIVPSTVLETIAAYRAAFRPGVLNEPRVMVSADVVVASDDETARRLASGYGPWVASIRAGGGAIPYPSPGEVAARGLSDAERALVADRVDTQFVGSPETVVRGLRVLRDATGADELLITTITHDHADRVRSYELLAEAWSRSSAVG